MSQAPGKISIDFVSDVACPWCAVGLGSLLAAIDRVKGTVQVELRLQPFELNPDMPAGGEPTLARLEKKYGYSREQLNANRAVISERAAAVGMPVRMTEDDKSYNTFDAHRLLHWAGLQGQEPQVALKKALLKTYHHDNHDTGATDVLLQAVKDAGLDVADARAVLESDRHADDVRAEEEKWQNAGISSVPAVIINDEYLVSGAQQVDVFEQALLQVAGERKA
ncbi:2-hydroxychromene-2-carboxylate isomerase/DsbA-like thioredoxin domain [plant metagenome]|uniref:2-hydroxychromene-2-carboxylate isomerase/DsbA-like thioredoxin domain n=1 Tax=plant metagenome TaxID=1297885 RepID=A0A484RYN5_9ZZZZ